MFEGEWDKTADNPPPFDRVAFDKAFEEAMPEWKN